MPCRNVKTTSFDGVVSYGIYKCTNIALQNKLIDILKKKTYK